MTRGDATESVDGNDVGESERADVAQRDDASERVARTDGSTVQVDPGADEGRGRAAAAEFGWPGYLLLGVMVVALVVAPLLVYLRPPQLSWRFTLIVLPLVPALAMAVVAVWATTRA